jgi:amicyanin
VTPATFFRTLGVVFAAATIAAAPGLSARADEPAATIHIQNSAFKPAKITVAAGTTVTWINDDEDLPHNIAAAGNAFESKLLGTGQIYSFTFAKPGTYEYFCTIHPYMRGKVIVK